MPPSLRYSVAIFSLSAAFTLPAYGQSSTQKGDDLSGRPVLVTPVHYASRHERRTFAATIRPRIESDLSFRVAGKVTRRFVDVGQTVKKGEWLASLDDTDFKLQYEQAAAEGVAARAALEQARADQKRATQLRKNGWQSQAAHDRVLSALEEARARLTRAERAEALAKNALGYSMLAAEVDGVVTNAPIEPGQVVVPGQLAVRIAKLDEKEAAVAVPEKLLDQVKRGEATLSLWSDPSKRYPAHLRELAPVSDAATRTYTARFSLPTADASLALGMTATLTIEDSPDTMLAQLPLTALLNQGRGPSVWIVVKEGHLKLMPVDVRRYDASSVYIAAGVPEGAQVVALGVQKLDEGQTVRVVTGLGE